MSKTAKRVLIAIISIIVVVVVVIGIYVAYFLLSSYRLDDDLALDVERISSGPSSEYQNESIELIESNPSEELQPEVNRTYTIASYNIGFGAYSADYSFFMDGGTESVARSEQAVLDNVGGALNVINDIDPDILLLQEVDIDGTRSYHVNEKELAQELLPQYESCVFAQNWDSPFIAYPLTQPHGANKAGICTFSKFFIEAALRRSLPLEENLMSLIDLDRCYSISRIPVDGQHELVIINLHLSAYTSDGTIAEEQLEMLVAQMRDEYEAGNWVIAGGDFNKDLLGSSSEIFGIGGDDYTWAQAIPASAIPSGISLIAPFDETQIVASCRNADHPYDDLSFLVTVDGFLVSNNVKVFDADVIDTGFEFSDHNPVLMSFELMSD